MTRVTVSEVSPHIKREYLALYLEHYGEILDGSTEERHEEGRFDITLDEQGFTYMPKRLNIEGRIMSDNDVSKTGELKELHD